MRKKLYVRNYHNFSSGQGYECVNCGCTRRLAASLPGPCDINHERVYLSDIWRVRVVLAKAEISIEALRIRRALGWPMPKRWLPESPGRTAPSLPVLYGLNA